MTFNVKLNAMWYESNILHYFQTRLYRVHTSLCALWGDTESLFEYMRVLASQELNPMIIPPDVLKTILHKIEKILNHMLGFHCVKMLIPIYGHIMGQ